MSKNSSLNLNNRLNNIASNILLNQVVNNKLKECCKDSSLQSLDEENNTNSAVLANEALEDDEIELWRRQRRKKLEMLKKKQKQYEEGGGGTYEEVGEKQFFHIVTKHKRAVCHFYHNGFQRCAIMDSHLRCLASKHVETRFFRINAEKAPFLTNKLRVTVLPTLALFLDGVAVNYIIGFERLGNQDNFKTETLFNLLCVEKVIWKHALNDSNSASDNDD